MDRLEELKELSKLYQHITCKEAVEQLCQLFDKPSGTIMMQFKNDGLWTNYLNVIDMQTKCENNTLKCKALMENGQTCRCQLIPYQYYKGPPND